MLLVDELQKHGIEIAFLTPSQLERIEGQLAAIAEQLAQIEKAKK